MGGKLKVKTRLTSVSMPAKEAKSKPEPVKNKTGGASRVFGLHITDVDRMKKVVAEMKAIYGKGASATKILRGAMMLAKPMSTSKLLDLIHDAHRPVVHESGSVVQMTNKITKRGYSFTDADMELLTSIVDNLNRQSSIQISMAQLLRGLILLAERTAPQRLAERMTEAQRRNFLAQSNIQG